MHEYENMTVLVLVQKNDVAGITWQPSITTFFSTLRTYAQLQRYASFNTVIVSGFLITQLMRFLRHTEINTPPVHEGKSCLFYRQYKQNLTNVGRRK